MVEARILCTDSIACVFFLRNTDAEECDEKEAVWEEEPDAALVEGSVAAVFRSRTLREAAAPGKRFASSGATRLLDLRSPDLAVDAVDMSLLALFPTKQHSLKLAGVLVQVYTRLSAFSQSPKHAKKKRQSPQADFREKDTTKTARSVSIKIICACCSYGVLRCVFRTTVHPDLDLIVPVVSA